KLVDTLPGENRIYLATMQVMDDESRQRVERHRRQRAGRGFVTVEREKGLGEVQLPQQPIVLLEDLVNLVANEMFGGGDVGRIPGDLEKLARNCRHLIMVTNDVFSDGVTYPPSVEEYLRCLSAVNMRAAGMADLVTEVVYSIPVVLKGALPWEIGQEGIRWETR
ncbi:MAG: bifunctional adenosylcobinamide kinase/adenosylcobinamide-phosphate guanylyltransferase, partial [Clostridia bacterium]|nr:bifunctional adenosylcobinamide kinase/adenosylcobinamide-phosphate guanylyltransferase [Clostridia bacterium]